MLNVNHILILKRITQFRKAEGIFEGSTSPRAPHVRHQRAASWEMLKNQQSAFAMSQRLSGALKLFKNWGRGKYENVDSPGATGREPEFSSGYYPGGQICASPSCFSFNCMIMCHYVSLFMCDYVPLRWNNITMSLELAWTYLSFMQWNYILVSLGSVL